MGGRGRWTESSRLAWATEGTHVKKKAEIKRVRGKEMGKEGEEGEDERGASPRLASEKTHVEVFHL